MKAHPATYRGARFRSRLEARWAAFFDQAGWRWEYEPIDLDGWAPDFALVGAEGPLMVEVKPIEWTNDPSNARDVMRHREDLEKVRAQTDREVLVLGCYPIGLPAAPTWSPPEYHLGVFWNEGTDHAVLTTNPDGSWDIAAYCGSYHNRLSGHYDGNLEPSPGANSVHHRWGEAGRLTQWKGR